MDSGRTKREAVNEYGLNLSLRYEQVAITSGKYTDPTFFEVLGKLCKIYEITSYEI